MEGQSACLIFDEGANESKNMSRKLNSPITELACLLAVVAGVAGTLSAQADDTTPAVTTNAPASSEPEAAVTTNAPASLAPEAAAITNAPSSSAPEAATTTNAPASSAPEAAVTTNAPASSTPEAAAITNTPASSAPEAAATTNAPVPATPEPAPTIPATTSSTNPVLPAASLATTPPPAYQPFNLGVDVGVTSGIGGVAGWRFSDHLGLVGGMEYFTYSMSRTINDVPYSAHLRLESEHVGLNIYPSKDSSFYLGLGAYFNQNRLSGSAVSDGTLTINGYTVPNGDAVTLKYQQQPVDPYVSIGGNIYFDKARHFSLGVELGAFYLGNPKVSLTSNDPGITPPEQAELNTNKQKLEHDLKRLPVWPVLRLSLNYSF